MSEPFSPSLSQLNDDCEWEALASQGTPRLRKNSYESDGFTSAVKNMNNISFNLEIDEEVESIDDDLCDDSVIFMDSNHFLSQDTLLIDPSPISKKCQRNLSASKKERHSRQYSEGNDERQESNQIQGGHQLQNVDQLQTGDQLHKNDQLSETDHFHIKSHLNEADHSEDIKNLQSVEDTISDGDQIEEKKSNDEDIKNLQNVEDTISDGDQIEEKKSNDEDIKNLQNVEDHIDDCDQIEEKKSDDVSIDILHRKMLVESSDENGSSFNCSQANEERPPASIISNDIQISNELTPVHLGKEAVEGYNSLPVNIMMNVNLEEEINELSKNPPSVNCLHKNVSAPNESKIFSPGACTPRLKSCTKLKVTPGTLTKNLSERIESVRSPIIDPSVLAACKSDSEEDRKGFSALKRRSKGGIGSSRQIKKIKKSAEDTFKFDEAPFDEHDNWIPYPFDFSKMRKSLSTPSINSKNIENTSCTQRDKFSLDKRKEDSIIQTSLSKNISVASSKSCFDSSKNKENLTISIEVSNSKEAMITPRQKLKSYEVTPIKSIYHEIPGDDVKTISSVRLSSLRKRSTLKSPLSSSRIPKYPSRSKKLFDGKYLIMVTGYRDRALNNLIEQLKEYGAITSTNKYILLKPGMKKKIIIAHPVALRSQTSLFGLALGLPILHPDWLTSCFQQGRIVDYDGGLSLKESISVGFSGSKNDDLFKGISIGIVTNPEESPSADDRHDFCETYTTILFICGVDTVVKCQNQSSLKDINILVSREYNKICQIAKRSGKIVVSDAWIMECLVRQEIVNVSDYLFYPLGMPSSPASESKRIPYVFINRTKVYVGDMVYLDEFKKSLGQITEILESSKTDKVNVRLDYYKRQDRKLIHCQKCGIVALSKILGRVVVVPDSSVGKMNYRDPSILHY